MNKIRLEKFICHSTQYSRKDIVRLLKKGMITVNGKIINKIVKVDPVKDIIKVCDNEIKYEKYHYYMFNKPSGYLCANSDFRAKTIFDLFDLKPTQYFSVGRLDKDTEGLLIITNDGKWTNWILKPQNHIPKTYFLEIDKDFDEKIRKHSDSIKIDGYEVTEYDFKFLNNRQCELTIYEGKYHQVKQMMSYFGFNVIYLKRIKFGDLELPNNLKLGSLIELNNHQKTLLKII
ncbi:pseudouridine synthase [Mycoplasma zalophidermidis]|uniref:pseudouridine synthase n=1 Tax=Mycoplasma zalophidermidis TaxID=398174 RepID=UPI001C111132|nr:pseudouridine synthase [Mycoplasma zalophidermidis]MBU4690025.1 pseudouridine synthase [Mycoplasma zalophidermidis]